MERGMTRENVNNSTTRRKFRIKKSKGGKYFVEPVIHVN